MRPDLELDEVLVAAISAIPKVAELIALIPAEDQLLALEAAEKSYLQTAHNLGYEGAEAHEWASAILVQLRAQTANAGT
jgi:hypothetical protein